jgi:hypothetical protein
MSQNSNNATKQKKKGHAPAHQNKFAWTHNPKSKLTAKILESPIVHVCRRCNEKMEWRKQFRKYKPLSKPGHCNECQQRNVMSAYHTICESCTINSAKAKALIKAATGSSEGDEEIPVPCKKRACAICVKELALRDREEEQNDEEIDSSMGRIRLRERKTMERQLAKEKTGSKSTTISSTGDEEIGPEQEMQKETVEDMDEDDPFLLAVGGADKLLTGIDYQQMLLKREQLRQP